MQKYELFNFETSSGNCIVYCDYMVKLPIVCKQSLCVAVMTALLRQMHEYHYKQYLDHFHTQIDLTDFLMEILMVFQNLVRNNVYPPDWNEMIMQQNR